MVLEDIVLHNLNLNREILYSLLNTYVDKLTSSSDGTTLRFDICHSSNAYVLSLDDSLRYYNFRNNEKGNILDLLSNLEGIDKNKYINQLYLSLNSNNKLVNECGEIEDWNENYIYQIPEIYNKECLEQYPKAISEMFLNDGIGIETQLFFNIRYDKRTRRVVIPVFYNNELIGAIGRRNAIHLQEKENKYMPIIRYSKSLVFFGYDIYYDLIQKTKIVMLVESEKSVMKMWQMKSKIPTLALGSNALSRNHIEILKLLQVDTIIFALDKSLDYADSLIPNIQRLKKYGRECKIKYIDVNNIPNNLLGEKEAICDRNREEIIEIFTKYLKDENF
ncbi:putative DNA primase [Fusobacterium phage vB_FnuS_FNU3]|uniref:DNA primase n=1 Tax=Fusobacterium phage Fnu1 TaxID=2530024 RepID=A0A481W5E8_9CAUD|nr:DNA primase [Fusobacterium phage Fnu1]QBJ04079.1 DNA primase [Fusobacterium phage Fnu1]WGH50208.1 putative DNA primase [Fusobacterium phage vB_FnuS_FNU2]WGH50357.1 putative DNA primase [Fusobacterium phage vB_FnuS_FNU3]